MKPLNVGIDMDGICVALHQHWLSKIAQDHGVTVPLEDITQWAMHKCGGLIPLGAKIVYGYLEQPGFFRTAPPIPGALEKIRQMFEAVNDKGEKKYNLFIVSSPASAVSAKEKYEWLGEFLPFLKPDNICLFPQKNLIKMDVLIDDRAETVEEYVKEWPTALVTGIAYPYNKSVDDQMAGDYTDTVSAWQAIYSLIEDKYFVAEFVAEMGGEDQAQFEKRD